MILICVMMALLGVDVFLAAMFLEREIRRHGVNCKEQLWQVNERLDVVMDEVKNLRVRLSETTKIVKDLEEQLKRAPETLFRDDEVRLSKSMEEGMANLLQYAAGRAPGVEVRL